MCVCVCVCVQMCVCVCVCVCIDGKRSACGEDRDTRGVFVFFFFDSHYTHTDVPLCSCSCSGNSCSITEVVVVIVVFYLFKYARAPGRPLSLLRRAEVFHVVFNVPRAYARTARFFILFFPSFFSFYSFYSFFTFIYLRSFFFFLATRSFIGTPGQFLFIISLRVTTRTSYILSIHMFVNRYLCYRLFLNDGDVCAVRMRAQCWTTAFKFADVTTDGRKGKFNINSDPAEQL
jgi:hypothetical protein